MARKRNAPDDTLYIATKKHVAALDAATGQELWRTQLPDASAGVISILVRGERVYAGSSGRVYGLDRATGDVLWYNDLPRLGWQHVVLAMEGTDSGAHSLIARVEADARAAAAAAATAG